MITQLLIYKILQLFAFMLLGFILAKARVVDRAGSMVLSKLSLYLFMPCAILNAFDFQASEGVGMGLVYSFSAAIVIHILLLILDALYGRFISKNAVERASVMYSNAGNLIIPVVSFVMGEEWVVFSVAFMSVQLFCIWSHGVRLFSADEKLNIGRVLLNVNIIAILAGVVMMLCGIRLPAFVGDVTSSLGGMLGPVGMLIAGILAAGVDYKRGLCQWRLYRVVAFRLLVYPLFALAVLKAFSMIPMADGDSILLITFLACITPSAATVMQFSQINNSDTEFATTVNICSTLGCILTMPMFVMLMSR